MSDIFSIAFVGATFATIAGSNTFRAGDKYASLRPGDILTGEIVSPENGEILDTASLVIKQVTIGRLGPLVAVLGNDNHAVKDGQAAGLLDINKLAGPLWLKTELTQNLYADEDLDDESVFTVIEFEDALFIDEEAGEEEPEDDDSSEIDPADEEETETILED
jgi:hypothetical protein